MNLFSGLYHCIKNIPFGVTPHKYLYPLYGFLPTQHLVQLFVSDTFVVAANFLGTNFSGILLIIESIDECMDDNDNAKFFFECNWTKSCRYKWVVLPKNRNSHDYLVTTNRLSTWQWHQDIFYDKQPNGSSGIQLINCGVVQFIQIQIIYSFFTSQYNMLIIGFRVDPWCWTIDFQWTFIEYFGKTSTHMNLGCRWQTINHMICLWLQWIIQFLVHMFVLTSRRCFWWYTYEIN